VNRLRLAVSLALGSALLACAPAKPIPQRGTVAERPDTFVSLSDVDATILLEMRYFGTHNFMGKRVLGYKAEKCILSRQAALALKGVQDDLRPFGLALKAYDCYRPQRAVDTFVAWAKDFDDTKMQAEFYPRVPKDRIFREGYLLERSGHSRGSTIDLTVVPLPPPQQEIYKDGDPLRDCGLPASARFRDNSLDFGTGYDCFDALANVDNPGIGLDQRTKRLMLRALMEKRGFKPYPPEWWHFTLKDEPYPETFFDFEIE
jgi:D-alanyl-D-alanine dipeptidase